MPAWYCWLLNFERLWRVALFLSVPTVFTAVVYSVVLWIPSLHSLFYSEYWKDFVAAVNTTLTYYHLLSIYRKFVQCCLFTCLACMSLLMLMLAFFSDSRFCPPDLTPVFALLSLAFVSTNSWGWKSSFKRSTLFTSGSLTLLVFSLVLGRYCAVRFYSCLLRL